MLNAAPAAPSIANAPRFSHEPRRETRDGREAPRAGPRACETERTRRARVPTDSSVGDFGDNHRFRDDGARSTSRDEPRGHARGRRERAALDHAPTKACEEARALSWPVRVAARAGKSSEHIGVDRSKSEFCLHFGSYALLLARVPRR